MRSSKHMRRKWRQRVIKEKVAEDNEEEEDASESESDYGYDAAMTAVDEGIQVANEK